jgi:hypothetical protein
MTFQDRNQPDPQQPLTLDQPQRQLAQQRAPSAPRDQPRMLPASVYIPRNADREPNDWGRPDWRDEAAIMNPAIPGGPDMPSGPEAYPTLARNAGMLARQGSDNVSESAGRLGSLAMSFSPVLDMLSRGTWSKNYNAAMLGRLKVQQQQMINEAEAVQQKHSAELLDYADIFARYDAVNGSSKSTDREKYEAKQEAEDDLRFLADSKYGHARLVSMLDSHGIDGAKRMLMEEDAIYRNIAAGTTTLKKVTGADEDAETARTWGKDPPSGSGGGGGIGVAGAAPSDSPARATPEGTPRAPGGPPSGDFNAALARRSNLSPQQMEAVREEVETGKPSAGTESLREGKQTGFDTDILRQNKQAVDTTNAQIDRIIDDPRMSPDQKMLEIARINKGVAQQIRDLGRYRIDPNEPGVANRTTMSNRARRLFGDRFQPANFKAIQDFKKEDSQGNKVLGRAGGMTEAALRVLSQLRERNESDLIPKDFFDRFVAGTYDPSDTKWAGLYDALLQFDQQFQGLQSGTGTARVGPSMEWIRKINTALSPAQLRTAIYQNVADAYNVLNTHESNWERLLGRRDELIPGITPHNYRAMRDLVRMDPKTGIMPADSTNEVLSVSRSPGQAQKEFRNRPPPLTMKEIREDYLPRIQRMRNSTDPEVKKHLPAALDRVGTSLQIGRVIPEVDGPDADER